MLDGPGFESRQAQKIFLFSEKSSPALRYSKPPIQYVPVFYPGRLIAELRMIPRLRMSGVVEASWNVMAHAQKLDFVFRRNGRVHLNQQRASVRSTTGSRGVHINDSNAGYTMFRGGVKSTGYPLHSSVSSRASPCAITFQLYSTSATSYALMTVKG